MQGVGNLTASALMYILLYLNVDLDIVWRVGLGFGGTSLHVRMYYSVLTCYSCAWSSRLLLPLDHA